MAKTIGILTSTDTRGRFSAVGHIRLIEFQMKNDAIVLVGMAGVGKSSIGKLLAESLGFDFVDLDEYIFKKDGRTVRMIVDEDGDEALLQLEKTRMFEINLSRVVVAPGGSIIYHAGLMKYLQGQSVVVHLDDSFENIEARLQSPADRGIVGLKTKALRQIYNERRPLYSRYAYTTIDCSNKSKHQVVDEIRQLFDRVRETEQ